MDTQPRSWIVGSSRSGSTWLTRVLARLGVATVDDPHLGHHLSVWRPISLAWATADPMGPEPELSTLPELRRGNPDYFFNDRYRSTWAPALRDMIDTRLRAQTGELAPAVVKDPGASGVATLLFELFPRDGMIFLLRDPRAVVASWLDGYGAAWGLDDGCYSLSGGVQQRKSFIRWQAAVWRQRTEECMSAAAQHDGPKCIIRYEHLRDPKFAVSEVSLAARVAQLETTHSTVETALEAESLERQGSTGDGNRVRRGEAAGWREELADWEVTAIEDEVGETLATAGYG